MNKEEINKILEKIENDEPLTDSDLKQTGVFTNDKKSESKAETYKDQKTTEQKSQDTSNDGSKKVEDNKPKTETKEDLTAEELEKELHSMEIKTNGKPIETCKPAIIPCANDLKISVKKYTGEYILEEDCCTAVAMILKNDGDLGISFMGAHNLEIVKMIEKNWKQYFKKLKKTLKDELKKHNADDDIKILQDNPSSNDTEEKVENDKQ